MSQEAAGLEDRARRIFELVDAMDAAGIAAMLTDDAQGIDEVRGGWMRGREAIEAYLGELAKTVDRLHSEVRELQATEWGDAGVVTCVVDQTYTLDGEEQRVTSPTSMALRREGGEWKVALFHSVPLPD